MKFLLTLLAFLSVTFLSAQVEVNNGSWFGWSGDRVRGNGEVITDTRDLDGFTGVDACCSFEIKIAQGDFAVRVEAESNLQEFIETRVSGKTLHIKYTDKANFKSTAPIVVYVSLPELELIDASSSSNITGTTPFTGDELTLDVSSSADITLTYTGKRVDIDASSSGRIDLKGKTGRIRAEASSAGKVDASDLETDEAVADVSSGARIEVKVNNSLRADASSGGSVEYGGSPSDVVTDTSSGGRVRSRN